jgi:hypothetical protein
MSTNLDTEKVIATIETLKKRIGDRFPDSGLYHTCDQIHELGSRTKDVVARIGTPIWPLRLLSGALILIFAASLCALLSQHEVKESISLYGLIQTMEAGGNLLILIGLGAVFVWSFEQRIRRKRATGAINTLRDVAHVIDMKQLTKDPDYVSKVVRPTAHSPKRDLDAFSLGRYLDYCTEMLSLVSKLGYLYVADFHDAEATKAVNELENLCSGLSRKIWQKIMVLGDQERAT